VPGLAAKPVLDMLAGVHDLHAAEAAIPVLTSHGYVHAQHRPATWCMRGIWRMPLGRLPYWTQALVRDALEPARQFAPLALGGERRRTRSRPMNMR
jgi:GrpB-like predicted nucleotidyltransferase (UPF0157 family)